MATGGLQRLVTLPPAPDSARHARRFVGEVLAAAGASWLTDTAVLLTSELVTNGIVHAHTDLSLAVEATPSWVRVEVGDGSAQLPARRDYDEGAVTGRGLEMVELLADDFGMEANEGDGKRVWFRLGVAPGAPEPEPAPAPAPAETWELVLERLPVGLYCAFQQHADALLREALIVSLDEAAPPTAGDFPLASQALSALADAADEVFTLRDNDVEVADVALAMARDSVTLLPIFREMLARAAAMSRAGQLLVPPSLPEVEALRNWICDEAARQFAGLAPQPWGGLPDDDAASPPEPRSSLDALRSSPKCLVAADVANRIVAVSGPAAALLGWAPEALEGRRLVTIIPPRLRDRHVAGFTRHIVDGSTRILGRAVLVPALRRDGSEVPVSLLIERGTEAAARALFVATLTPA